MNVYRVKEKTFKHITRGYAAKYMDTCKKRVHMNICSLALNIFGLIL